MLLQRRTPPPVPTQGIGCKNYGLEELSTTLGQGPLRKPHILFPDTPWPCPSLLPEGLSAELKSNLLAPLLPLCLSRVSLIILCCFFYPFPLPSFPLKPLSWALPLCPASCSLSRLTLICHLNLWG